VKKSTANQRKEYNVLKYILWATILSLTIHVWVSPSSFFSAGRVLTLSPVLRPDAQPDNMGLCCCCHPYLQNCVKFRENSNFGSRSSKVIDLGANLKHICHFLLVISGNYVLISYRWTNYDARWLIGRVFRQDGAFWVSL